MGQVKYMSSKVLGDGSTVWLINPPRYVKEAIGASYEQCNNRQDAKYKAEKIAEQYSNYKRKEKRDIYINQDTVLGLVSQYKNTNSWNKLQPNSHRTYDQLLRSILRVRIGSSTKMFEDMMVRHVDVAYVETLYSQLSKDISMHRANHTCKVLRRIWTVGERLGLNRTNPFKNMGIKSTPSRKILWEPEQVHTFVDKADEMGLPSIGTMALLCYDLCQRPGDMRQLTWTNFDSESFAFAQEKTKTEVDILASPRLVERLKTIKSASWHDNIVYYEKTGVPYDRRQYNKVFCIIRNAAGLPSHLQLRDLRRTGATEMAESGCTNTELRAVTGHKSIDVLSIYVRPTKKLAAAGINKRFG